MIIQFSVANFRSFNDIQTLSFRAANLTSEDSGVDEKNIVTEDRNRFLKVIGIYGANASGKSNLINALNFFKIIVEDSLSDERVSESFYSPFRQTTRTQDNAGFFQMVLALEGRIYRYGFTLELDGTIQKEWLFGPAEKNETYYFKRENGKANSNKDFFKEGANLPEEKLRSDTLFLTFCASYDGTISRLIKDYISGKIAVERNMAGFARSVRSTSFRRRLTDNLVNDGKKDIVLQWLKDAGLFFSDIEIKTVEFEKRIMGNYVELYKNIYDDNGEIAGQVSMNLDADESQGTQKFYRYIGGLYPLFQNGGAYVSDEIDSNFHPFLLQKLIRMFQNPNVNRAGAQLLFTSHNTNLMHPDNMRRDQFYFTEKTLKDETQLYSMSDLKGIRNNADFARQYLAGFYGALPQLGNYLENNKIVDKK